LETFAHIKTVIGIILGLSITHSLKGAVKLIDHPGRIKSYPIHLLWVFYMFLSTVYFWWFEVYLTEIKHWDFFKYFFLICYVLQYYILAALLFPDDLRDFKSYKDYFYSRKKWFFSFLALLFVFDAFDTYIKGANYLTEIHWLYPIRAVVHIIACIFAMQSSNTRFHFILVLTFIILQAMWILKFYLNI
jgi:hypothetical protein